MLARQHSVLAGLQVLKALQDAHVTSTTENWNEAGLRALRLEGRQQEYEKLQTGLVAASEQVREAQGGWKMCGMEA